MRSSQVHNAAQRARRGFSVVEVIVALVLVTVGLLGVAGNGALAVRVSGAAVRERRAVQRAADRIANLASRSCASARSGRLVDGAGAITERWTVAAAVNGIVLVDAEVRWATPTGSRVVVLRDAMVC
ncbi:MAG: prepilin-type N-terminal cleavage/methylation domain-containing protein [Gemmatimonadaceae bacterium]